MNFRKLLGEKNLEETSKQLLENISIKKCWAISAKTLLNFALLRGSKAVVPLLGKGEGVFAPVMGWEKYNEIVIRVFGEANKKLNHLVKEMLNLEVENAVDAAKLHIVVGKLQNGPESEYELIEESKEKAVIRMSKCGWRERYKEFGINPELTICQPAHEGPTQEALKEMNPKLRLKFTKSYSKGDPYCEAVIEFKEK